jgi:hypothetical protein
LGLFAGEKATLVDASARASAHSRNSARRVQPGSEMAREFGRVTTCARRR